MAKQAFAEVESKGFEGVESYQESDQGHTKAVTVEAPIDGVLIYDTIGAFAGGLAQLGERLAGSQKVIGSSPLSSTMRKALKNKCLRHFEISVVWVI